MCIISTISRTGMLNNSNMSVQRKWLLTCFKRHYENWLSVNKVDPYLICNLRVKTVSLYKMW